MASVRTHRDAITALCLIASGCTSNLGGEPTVTSTWSLEVETNGGLVDPRFPEYGVYPNPQQVEALELRLDEAGQLCARAGGRDWCGGPISGIPYQVHERIKPGFVCHRVVDLFGHGIVERCSPAAEVRSARASIEAAPMENGEDCQEARNAMGAPCLVCMNGSGIVTKNTCLTGGGPPGDIPTTGTAGTPTPGSEPGTGVPSGAPEDGTPGTGTSGSAAPMPPAPTPAGSSGTAGPTPSTGFDCASARDFGAQLLFEEVNEGLRIVGMGVEVTHPGDLSRLNGADADDLVVGRSHCFDVFVNAIDYLDDGPGSGDYVYGPAAIWECIGPERDCRVGQMVTRSMYEACLRVPVGCDQLRVEEGIIAGGAHAIQSLCADGRPWDCRGSPLVLDLDDDGLALSGPTDGVRFPLMSSAPVATGWIRGGVENDDVMLGLDRDGTGCIESGAELFGESTRPGIGDGFTALAGHDDNRDGVIDEHDAVFSSLVAWRDDGDAVCKSSELSSLPTRGIRAIALDAAEWGERDRTGNELGLLGRALAGDGRVVPVVDVWFRFASAPSESMARSRP